jgi:autotransporter translocation and assembly factor TamB
MAAYSVFYLNIDLLPWKLSRGGGVFQLELDKRPGRKSIDSRLQITNFLANRQTIRSLQGEVHITPPVSRGQFTIAASDLNSRAELEIADHKTTIHFLNVAGEAQKILKILDLDMNLRGKITGDFTYRAGTALPEPEVEGSLAAPRLTFMGYELAQVSSRLRTNLKGITLNGLDFLYKEGRARAEVSIDFGQKRFDLQGRIDGIDVSRLQGDIAGRADLEINGRGEFLKDPLEIAYRFRDMHFYGDRGFSVNGKARILTDFSDFRLTTSGEAVNPASASPFALEINRNGQRFSGSFNFNLNDLDLLIPWKNNVGNMRLLGQIYTRADGGIGSRGVAIFSGRTLSLPNFSHSLDNFNGTVTFADKNFSLQSLSGEMGGGKVEGSGRLAIAGGELKGLSFNLQGKNLHLYPMDRTSCLVNPDLTLKYEEKKLLLSGTLAFQSVEWMREIDDPIVFNTHSELSTAESRIREMLRLDIAMNCENILMNNSLGRISGRFKLRLTGNASFPILTGTCEGSQGEIYFSDRPFNLLKAKLVFNNKFFIDPLIHIESEAFIQNYRIRFDISGSTSHAKPELVSSPPLPPQDILALVSLGETFKRSGSAETSSQLGSTAMITTKLTEEIKNRANKLLGINMLRIDPVLSGQSTVDSSRLTIGKKISKDLIVVYSTNLSTSRQEILYMQYQLSPAISLIAMRNEEGRYSLDLRLRSRR